jgi:transposase
MNKTYIGVDVSKDTLEVFIPGHKPSQYTNNKAGTGSLLKALQRLDGAVHVVCESTGGYERALAMTMWTQGMAISIVNPRQIHDFARSRGQLAKTDGIDARIISEYGRTNEPSATPMPGKTQMELIALLDHRSQLIDMCTEQNNQREYASDELILRQMDLLDEMINKQIKELNALIIKKINADPEMKRKAERMMQVKGVAEVTAASMIAYMPELGTMNRNQVAALAGLAPMNHDSGKMRGKRSISGGRTKVRRALFMAAVCHRRDDKTAKEQYLKLRERGKSYKCAMTAMMRHLIILLNIMLKNPDFKLKSTP